MPDPAQVLEAVAAGRVSVAEALAQLNAAPPSAELGYATVDLDREARCGFPEVVYAENKTAEWTAGALDALVAAKQAAFATRIPPAQFDGLAARFPGAELDRVARTLWLPPPGWASANFGDVLVVTAGTSDLPVAMEAANTARAMGAGVEVISDVGVAGLHRVLAKLPRLRRADVIIVVAGMDGALPSVVGGLVACPVIAVPTSTGYGAAFGGVAALLSMLNSCAAGVAVVNIDAGFKAGDLAARIARGASASPPPA